MNKFRQEKIMDELIEKEVCELYVYCKEHGFGNTMELVSALWRYDAEKKGYPTDGCFAITFRNFIKKEYRDAFDKTCSDYDDLVKKVLDTIS